MSQLRRRPRWESVAVNELIAAVNNALTGCPPDASGMLLQAPADMSALDAVASSTISAARQAPSSAAQENVLIRNRIELGFTPGATVGQANELLNSVGGRIFMMLCERADPVGPGA